MRLGLVASAGIAWLLPEAGLSGFAFAARTHEGSVPAVGRARTATSLRVQGSCLSRSHEVAHATMSNAAAEGIAGRVTTKRRIPPGPRQDVGIVTPPPPSFLGPLSTAASAAGAGNISSESAAAPPKKPPPVVAPAGTATTTAAGASRTARAGATPEVAQAPATAAAAATRGGGGGGGEATGTTVRFESGRRPVAADVGERERGVPSVTLKLAMDRTGAVDDMAEGPKRFTSRESLDAVHRIRRDCGAVLVGVGTVVRDDPSLTVRRVPLHEGQTQQPTRVVLDRTLRLTEGQPPGQAKRAILRDGHSSVVFYSAGSEETDARAVQLKAGVERSENAASCQASPSTVDFVGLPARSPGAGVDLVTVLEALFERGVEHVLVEGGPGVARGFLSEGLVDRAIIVHAPMEFSRPVPSGISTDTLQRAGLEVVGCTRWGNDAVECWTRPGLSWPGGTVGSWP